MQNTVSLEVLTVVAENGFSFDELVISTGDLFQREGMPGLIGLILRLVDENLSICLQQKKSHWQPSACCEHPDYESQDQLPRSFRTSAGFGKDPLAAFALSPLWQKHGAATRVPRSANVSVPNRGASVPE